MRGWRKGWKGVDDGRRGGGKEWRGWRGVKGWRRAGEQRKEEGGRKGSGGVDGEWEGSLEAGRRGVEDEWKDEGRWRRSQGGRLVFL